jgi:hypothetical protein
LNSLDFSRKKGQIHNIANKSFENVAWFKYFKTGRNKNYIQKEMKSRLNVGGCLVTYTSGSFVFPAAIYKCKH